MFLDVRMPLPSTIRRIVLIGFMGAGKSTTGALLARNLGWRFVDSDHAIEEQAGRTVAQIFAEDGEEAFRTLEAEAIREHARSENLVLALGGGAIETDRTRAALDALADARIVFLDAPLDVMVARCLTQPNAAERPVLADRERLLERFSNRLPHYRRAHLIVATAQLTPDEVAESIVTGLAGAETVDATVNAAWEQDPA
jgi:shikimate kinase